MSYDDCKELFIYTEACINAYLNTSIALKVKEAEEKELIYFNKEIQFS